MEENVVFSCFPPLMSILFLGDHKQKHRTSVCYLVEVVQGLVQVGVHASGWFVCDLDGVLQDALWDDVALTGGGGLGTDKQPEVLVASLRMLLQKFLQIA